jgi:formate hydrogenlyase subunit 3/multisubunit Na+/H+ antiporter MnhD subunit
MSTPIVWILLPLLIAGMMLFLTNRPVFLKWLGTGTGFSLALSALIIPVNRVFNFLFWEMVISDQLLVFGRRFVLGESDRPIVALLFFVAAFWFLLLEPKTTPIQTIPLGLGGITLILTAFAVEPLFYGSLFFAFLALIYVVLLSPPGSKPTPGVMRFLIFQVLGILFILFAAWLASWIDLNSDDQILLTRSMLILGLGFSFLLAIFPFISWVPMVAERNHPFLSGFVFNTYFLGVILFGTRFITEGGWLGQGVSTQGALQIAGIMMIGTGGILAVFSNHLGRLTSSLVLAEIGRALLAISLFQAGFPLFFAMVIIQAIALGIWSLSLTNLQGVIGELDYENAAGSAWQWPVTSSGLLVAYFSLAGMPLLAGFPLYWALGSGLSSYPLWISIFYLAASSGLFIGGLRIFGLITRNSGEETVLIASRPFYRYLLLGLNLILILLGFIPQVLIKISQSIAELLLSS